MRVGVTSKGRLMSKADTKDSVETSAPHPRRPRIGLALGAGSARGWTHIGVIQALREAGIEPDIVTGTSIGALVGAMYAMNRLEEFGDWVMQLRWRDVAGFFDISLVGGFIEGKKLFDFFRQHYPDTAIEALQKPFIAVATRLDNGHEVWLREGSVLDAARASVAVPGFFTPFYHQGHWLVDGGLVNPVPVSVCRVLGADLIIAVSPSSRPHLPLKPAAQQADADAKDDAKDPSGLAAKITRMMRQGAATLSGRIKSGTPSLFEVVGDSLEIMQSRVMRSRMAGEPPDIFLQPQVPDIGFLEFHRGREAIEAGRCVVKDNLQQLEALRLD